MLSFYLITFLALLLPFSFSQTTFYIEETSKTNNPYGSRENPFLSLDDTALRLYAGTFNIILLGPSITITSQVIFPAGSICTIRPERVPESGYFPLKIAIGASISVLQTNVTFQDIQFIEMDLYRDPMTNAITVSAGFLFLNSVLVEDIQYQDSPYIFISAGEEKVTGTGLVLLDTLFRNLGNVQIYTTQALVVVQNASFENIETDHGAFLTLFSSNLQNTGMEMLNISLMNARFGYTEDKDSVGFVQISESSVDFSLGVFSARNVSVVNGVPLIGIKDQEEDPEYPTKVNIWDVLLEDIVEAEDEQITEGNGLIFDIAGPSELTVRNLTAKNVRLEKGSLLRYLPDTSQFLFTYDVFPEILLQDIKIYNSSNTNFLIFWVDGGLVQNVEFVNVESKNFPMFFFQNAGTVSVENVSGRNFSGSVISLQQVFSQNLENLTFENVSAAQENAFSGAQSLVFLRRSANIMTLGLRANVDQSTVISDFLIDGYQLIQVEDEEGNQNKAYLMRIEAEIGTVLIRDSMWRSINTGGLFSSNMNALKVIRKRNCNHLKVDNLTVSGMASPAAEIFWFESFHFVKIANSVFSNNENKGLLTVDIPEAAEDIPIEPIIVFKNIIVIENNAKSEEKNNSPLSNLFDLKSPKRLVQAAFTNCLFQDNEICKALKNLLVFNNDGIAGSVIKISESQSVNISLENNTFVRNSAGGDGGIFSTENMQGNTSILTANNNVFQDNVCQENGGVFYFLDSWYQVSLGNNTYKNNTSAENGGVGYVLRSTISFYEQNSFYSDNSAEVNGGLWFIRSSNQLQNPQPPISFTNTAFDDSFAGSNAGAFYVLYGNLSINGSVFTKSRAQESGGVFYLEAFSSLLINGSNFENISAPEGSLIFAASLLNASIVIQDTNVRNSEGEGTLVDVNSGLVVVNNSEISEISGQLLFDFQGSSVEFSGVRINDIDCSEVKEACVVNGESVELEWKDTEISDVVVLQGDLVVLDAKSVEKGEEELTAVNITKLK